MSHICNTLFIGKVLLRYNSLDSTNLEAQRMLLHTSKPIEGTVIIAEKQSEGKGQRGNQWESPIGQNLLSSYILYPKHFLPKQQFNLNIIASLGVVDLLHELGIYSACVKWPNDIYIGKKKVAGILIQNNITNQYIASTIIGIGLNVNQSEFDSRLPNPTSIKNSLALDQDLDLEFILDRVCYYLEKRYLQSKTTLGVQQMRKDYTEQMFRLNEVASYQIDGKAQAGIIEGIDEMGKLILRMEDHLRVFDFQELRFLM